MIRRILAVAALPAAALAVTLGTTAASASTGPATYNNGSTEGGGYLASQAQFRQNGLQSLKTWTTHSQQADPTPVWRRIRRCRFLCFAPRLRAAADVLEQHRRAEQPAIIAARAVSEIAHRPIARPAAQRIDHHREIRFAFDKIAQHVASKQQIAV